MVDRSFLGWPFFDAVHRALVPQAEAFAAGYGAVDHHDVDGACRALVRALGEAGLLGLTAPDPDESGARLDVRSLALMRETLARHDGLMDFAFAMQGLGMGPVSLKGDDAQRRRWLPETRAGRAIAAFALTEPQSGSDVANLAMTARADGAEYVLDGEKTWISNGGIADVMVVFARTGGPGSKGLSAFIVPADAPGLSVAERLETMAPHPLERLRFEACRVPASARIGAEGQGFAIAMATLDVFRSTVGAAALGFARKALDLALARVTTRVLGGAPMSAMQMVQGHLAEMALGIDAAALLIYRAGWLKDSGQPRISREAAMAKLYATEMAQKTIDAAVQLHGGDGVRSGHPVEMLYRDIRALRIYEGASDVQKIIIARATLEEFADARHPA